MPNVGKKEQFVQQFILRRLGTDFTIHLVFSYLALVPPHHLSVNKKYLRMIAIIIVFETLNCFTIHRLSLRELCMFIFYLVLFSCALYLCTKNPRRT